MTVGLRFIYHVTTHTNPIVNIIGNYALACATLPMGTNMAFLRFRHGIEFDNRLHDTLDCIKIYHQLDENQRQIRNVLGELQDCKFGSKYIDGLDEDDIACIIYCILTQKDVGWQV